MLGTRRIACLLIGLIVLCAAPQMRAQGDRHWVASWGAAPVASSNEKTALFAEDATVRDRIRISTGGSAFRLVLTNEFGAQSLVVGGVSVAFEGKDGAIIKDSMHAVTFNGAAGITIPAGASFVSDAVDVKVDALQQLSVSIFLPAQKISTLTIHSTSSTSNWIAAGNQLNSVVLTDAKKTTPWIFLKGVSVAKAADSASIVAFGDSITDGYKSTTDKNRRWPDVLAERLQASKQLADIGVVDLGISGNRVLHDGSGSNALARFDRDVLSQDGVKYVVFLESINDIGHAVTPRDANDVVTPDQLNTAIKQLVERAHAHGIKVFGATLTPFGGAKYENPQGEAMRQAVNAFIRTNKIFDGVIDFDKVTRDPEKPTRFLPAYDSGDNLHPGDSGYKAMGESIFLGLFSQK